MAAMCVAIVLIFLITVTRLSLRYFRSDLNWGWDDWLIVPAAVCIQDMGGETSQLANPLFRLVLLVS